MKLSCNNCDHKETCPKKRKRKQACKEWEHTIEKVYLDEEE